MKPTLKKVLRWILWIVAIAFGLLMLLTVLLAADAAWIVELPFYLVAGWYFYLDRIEDEIIWNWEAIVSGLAYLVLSVAGLHWIIRSLAESRGRPWRWRWSIQISALFLIIFGVSLAIGGLVHQAVWLARADKWIGDSRSFPILDQVGNARNVVQAMHIYASDHGGLYPASTDALYASHYVDSWEEIAYYAPPGDEPPAPWIYVRGLTDNAPGDLPILIAPRTVSGNRRIIARNDGSVALENPSTIREHLLPKWKEGYAALGLPLPPVLAEYERDDPQGQSAPKE